VLDFPVQNPRSLIRSKNCLASARAIRKAASVPVALPHCGREGGTPPIVARPPNLAGPKTVARLPKLAVLLTHCSKFDATRCQILMLKCTKFDFRWGSVPDPAGEAYSTPLDLLAAFKGPISKGRAGEKERKKKGGSEGM